MNYTLSSIVDELLIELGESQTNKAARFYQLGLSFLRKTHFNTDGVPKVVELVINDNDTANLPSDYVRYTRIALCCGGRLYSLGIDNTLCLNKSYNDCGVPIGHSNQFNSNTNLDIAQGFYTGPFIADNFVNGEFVGRMFGIGADNNCNGYYRIDTENNQILFANLAQTSSVILEYLADVSAVDEDFQVHPFAVEALKDWMHWKYKQRCNKPLGEQQLAREDFYNSNRLMRMMFNSSTNDEWVAAFASGNQASPKM